MIRRTIERAKFICVDLANETDLAKVRRHAQKVMYEVGAEQLRMDELSVYGFFAPENCITLFVLR